MTVTCPKCGKVYDDVYRWTYCPHEKFQMRTIINKGKETYVATTLAQADQIIHGKPETN